MSVDDLARLADETGARGSELLQDLREVIGKSASRPRPPAAFPEVQVTVTHGKAGAPELPAVRLVDELRYLRESKIKDLFRRLLDECSDPQGLPALIEAHDAIWTCIEERAVWP